MKIYNEVRLRKGKPDDIVLNNGDMHLEDMDGKFWWLGFYRKGKRITFHITSKTKIYVKVIENEVGAKEVEQENT